VRRVAAWLLWWIALFWLWMLLVGEWNRIEWIAGACAATIGASVAEYMRWALDLRFRIPLDRVPTVATALAMVFVDYGIVMGVLFRSLARRKIHRGRFIARDFAAGGDSPRAFGNRGWTTLVANYSPNAYVVDIDQERDLVLLHDLVPFRKSEEPA
jgi:hypothetical protein